MIPPGTDLVRRDSIEELCGHRARALQLYTQALATLRAAQQAHSRACAGGRIENEFLRDMRYLDDATRFAAAAQATIDRDMWTHFIVGTPLGSLMDGQERRRFEESLRGTPPEITPDTVFATMAQLAGNAGTIFRRGLVSAFQGFCGDYKSHDGFKIGPRFVVSGLVTGSGTYINQYRQDSVRDIDRCMHVLDGKPAPDYQQGILAAIRTALQNGSAEARSDYFRVRLFRGNGNAHFYPLRTDLVEKANRLIAEHFGDALGAAPGARK
ncbi:MAG: DUF4942 domain-containing protein [Patescibacteria group bacterium]|nr:DUF4942 domain-containing protein [Patescibacteria group bacterium]